MAAVIVAAALLVVFSVSPRELVLSDADTGEVCLRLPVRDGDRFSVTFIHSVHKTPVTETYEVRGKDIYAVECRFYTFGAGMQSDYSDGVTYTYGDDGATVASGYDILCTGMTYCVGMVSDHTLSMGGARYSLRDLCGRGTLVAFTVR